jgi:hypothetical protein
MACHRTMKIERLQRTDTGWVCCRDWQDCAFQRGHDRILRGRV